MPPIVSLKYINVPNSLQRAASSSFNEGCCSGSWHIAALAIFYDFEIAVGRKFKTVKKMLPQKENVGCDVMASSPVFMFGYWQRHFWLGVQAKRA